MHLKAGAHVHLVGICGTAMAGLAGLLRSRGFRVTGSDEGVYPPMSTYLQGLDIAADSGFDERHLDPAPDLVVIGNAIRRGNPEAELTLDRRLPFTSLPVLVKELLLPGKRAAVVAGTHGKTTTASMLAHILGAAGEDPSFLIGGIPLGAGAPARLGSGPAFVLEGDEYDTAFFDKGPKLMHYLPDVAILNAVEMDHADIYKDLDTVKLQFRRWVNIIPRRSLLLINGDDPGAVEVAEKALCRVESFGQGARNEWCIEDLVETSEGTVFDLASPGTVDPSTARARPAFEARGGAPSETRGTPAAARGPSAPDANACADKPLALAGGGGTSAATAKAPRTSEPQRGDGPRVRVRIPTAGAFNARNAVAAIAAARELGVQLERGVEAMASFPGVRRRLEIRGQARGVTVVDDFAHHPTAIRETLRAARAKWPSGRIIAILEPRSWSLRRNLFQSELPAALAAADMVAISAVYRGAMLDASERLDVPRVVREIESLGVPARHEASGAAIVASLTPELRPGDVLLVMSNGGFDAIHEQFLAALAP